MSCYLKPRTGTKRGVRFRKRIKYKYIFLSQSKQLKFIKNSTFIYMSNNTQYNYFEFINPQFNDFLPHTAQYN